MIPVSIKYAYTQKKTWEELFGSEDKELLNAYFVHLASILAVFVLWGDILFFTAMYCLLMLVIVLYFYKKLIARGHILLVMLVSLFVVLRYYL